MTKNWIFANELKLVVEFQCRSSSFAFNWIRAFYFLLPHLHNSTSAWFNMRNFCKCNEYVIIDASKIWRWILTIFTSWRACDAHIFNNDWRKSMIELQFWGETGPFTSDIVSNVRLTVYLSMETVTYFRAMIDYFSPFLFAFLTIPTWPFLSIMKFWDRKSADSTRVHVKCRTKLVFYYHRMTIYWSEIIVNLVSVNIRQHLNKTFSFHLAKPQKKKLIPRYLKFLAFKLDHKVENMRNWQQNGLIWFILSIWLIDVERTTSPLLMMLYRFSIYLCACVKSSHCLFIGNQTVRVAHFSLQISGNSSFSLFVSFYTYFFLSTKSQCK